MIHEHRFAIYGNVGNRFVNYRGTLVWQWDAKKEVLKEPPTLISYPGFEGLVPGYQLEAILYDFSTTEAFERDNAFYQRWLVRVQVVAQAVMKSPRRVVEIGKLTGNFSEPEYLTLDIGREFGGPLPAKRSSARVPRSRLPRKSGAIDLFDKR
jgi:hypothetical protein